MPLSAKQVQVLIGIGVTAIVANYSVLPSPSSVANQLYWVEASQGTSWLPGSMGGTYYPLGLYYSNGTSWEYMPTAWQASQTTVNTGTNNDQFVTALTFTNASKWSTKQDTGNYITTLTGDGTASGPGSSTFTLATVLSVLTKGSASKTVTITTDAKGRVTALADQNILITESQVTGLVTDLAAKQSSTLTNTHILVGNGSNVATDVALSGDATITNAGVLALSSIIASATKGAVDKTITINYDAKGRLISVVENSIQITESQVTNLASDLAGKVVGPSSATNNAIAVYDLAAGKLIKNTLVTIDSSGGITVPGVTSSTYSAKKIEYDNTLNQWLLYDNDANTALNVGYETWFICLNNTGSTIPNGSVVYISGADGTTGVHTIALAKGDTGTTAVGIGITTESIANNTAGKVTQSGLVNGMDTSLLTAGTVYVSATVAGGLTNTAPLSPNYRMRVGFVGKVNSTVGTVLVTPSTASVGNGTTNQIRAINAAGTSEQFRSTTDFIGNTAITFAAGNDSRFYDDAILLEQAFGSPVLAQTMPMRAINTVVTPVSQTVYFTGIYYRNTGTITGVKWLQSTKGNYTASNYNGVGIYSYSAGTLTLVASSTNDGATWQTATNGTLGSKAFSSTYSAIAGAYVIGFVYSASAATTAPILGAGPALIAGASIGDFTNSAKITGQLATQTALPTSLAMSTISVVASNFFIELY